MQTRSQTRRRPPGPRAAAILAAAAAARSPAPLPSPAHTGHDPGAASNSTPPVSRPAAPAARRSPEGPPRATYLFTPVAAANRVSPGASRVYRQVQGLRFTRLSLMKREEYTRYVGDENFQRGRVDENYSLFPAGYTTGDRPEPPPRPRFSPLIPRPAPNYNPGFALSSPAYHRAESELITPWKRIKRGTIRHWFWLLVLVLLALFIRKDPGRLRQAFEAILWPPGDSDGNAARVLVDPLGTDHIPYVASSALSIDGICNRKDGTGIASGIANRVSRTVQDFSTWIELMRTSEEHELRALGGRFDTEQRDGLRVKALANDLELRICWYANHLMDKGLVHDSSRALAAKLRSYKERAQKIKPEQTALRETIAWTAAKPAEWGYTLVDDALQELQQHLRNREQLARNMSTEAGKLVGGHKEFVELYSRFRLYPETADGRRKEVCSHIKASTWNCTAKTHSKLLHDASEGRDKARQWALVAQYYLTSSRDIWENYAMHLDDGLSLLADLPKLKRDLTAEGIPARIEHLYSLFENLAKQADLTAERLQDAFERKYIVELNLEALPEVERITKGPFQLRICTACDERAASSWSSSSSSDYSSWLISRQSLLREPPPTGTPTWSVRVSQVTPRAEKWSSAFSSPETTTTTDLVKVVNILG